MNRDNKLIFFSLVTWGIGEGLFWFLLPLYIADLGADSVQIGFVLSVAIAVMTATLIPAGWLADRVPRRPILIAGWVMGTTAVILISLAQDWVQIIPGWILYNLSAFNMPALNAYVTTASKGQDLKRTYTSVFAGFTIGATLSPIFGGWLADLWGLRQVFHLAAVFFVLSTILIALVRDQPVTRTTTRSSMASLRDNRTLVMLCGLFFCIHLVGYLGVPLAPNFLQEKRGLSMSWIGFLGSAAGLGSAVLTIGLGRWPKGRAGGLVLTEAALASYNALLLSSGAVPLVALGFFLRGGLGAMRALAGALLGGMIPPTSLALGFAVFQAVAQLAFAIAPYIAGWLYAFDPSWPFVASLALLPPVMLATGLIAGRAPATRQTPE